MTNDDPLYVHTLECALEGAEKEIKWLEDELRMARWQLEKQQERENPLFMGEPLIRNCEEIERSHQREAMMKGECLMLADVLRDAFEVVKTVEGEEQDESDKLAELCLSIAHALALYDDKRSI